jgi:DNA-binding SARP family transcriptional activator/tetratricopeptide (TPR) repeat protein
MEFRLLGPLEVHRDDGRPVRLAPKEQALLAALLLSANKVVPADRLIEQIWGSPAPGVTRNTLHVLVGRLRRALRPDGAGPSAELPRTCPPGYLLEATPGQLDLHRFEELVAGARQLEAAGDLQQASGCLRAGLALWRGPALAGVHADGLRRIDAPRLEERRLAVLEERIELDLRLGRYAELVGELTALVAEHPLRELLSGQLMRALYCSGRQADALSLYRQVRGALAGELGLEPCPALQELERAILHADPALEPVLPAANEAPRQPAFPPEPCQLPPDIDDFTGRNDAVAQVQQLLKGERATAIVISAIAGKAGVGKTALAMRVAHRLRPHFPDGQLYVNLRGAEAQALDPAEVLAGFLRALGLEGTVIGERLEDRVRQFRAQLADRRVLVVLDNAASEAQVRPLLPASHGCAALVTSRASLSGLEAAHPLTLDVLDSDQAVALLARLAGPDRVAAEPHAAQQIVRLCGWLPLAVRIAGARLASRPHWRLALLAGRLADERRRLDELVTGDLEVRASVALSYHGRSEAERLLFRLLGVLAAPNFPAWVAASLLDTELAEAEKLLERLVDAQLVEAAGEDQVGQLRYRLHDLLRVYARERLHGEELAPARRASLARMLGTYLTLAERANAVLEPSGLAHYGSGPARGQHADHPAVATVEHDPMRWFEAERTSLVAAVEQAGDAGLWEFCWRLADTLVSFFGAHAHWDDWRQTHTMALTAVRRASARDAEARILGSLGDLHADRYRFDDAGCCLHQSLAAFRETGNRRGEFQILLTLGGIDVRQGRFGDAAARFEQSLAGFRELGWRSGEANALWELGEVHRLQGRLDAAIVCLEQSLTLMRAVGDRPWEAPILRSLGLIHSTQGRFGEAISCLEQSLALARAAGDRHGEAYVLQSLGEVHCKQVCLDDAASCLEQSLAFARATGDRAAEAYGLHTLGDVRRQQGRLDDAAGCLEPSLAAFRDLGYRHCEARALDSLGVLQAAKGDPTAARSAWRAASTIFRELGMPEAADVAARLDRPSSRVLR